MANKKPFDREYIIELTKANVGKAIDFSIQKTIARIPEFEDDGKKSLELFKTLSDLNQMKKVYK